MAAIRNTTGSGSGIGVSGPALATASPRPEPRQLSTQGSVAVAGAPDGPSPQVLKAAWDAYNGHFEGAQNAGPNEGPLAQQSGVPNLNVLSNRIRAIVNTGVDFLFGPPLSVKVTDAVADEDADAPGVTTETRVSDEARLAQRILDAAFGDDDQRMTRFAKLGVNGSVYGHAFVKIVAPRRGDASEANPPRLVLLSPENVSIFPDPEDRDLVARYRIEYQLEDAQGRPLRKRQDITRVDPNDDDSGTPGGFDDDTTWQIQNFTAQGAIGNNFVPDGPAEVWPYELPPLAEWQNYPNPNCVWGQADVTEGLVALNRQLRLVESNINKIGFLQGHPILWSTGTDTGGMKPTPGEIIDLQAPDARLDKVDASGNLDQLMTFAEQLRSDMDEESGVPGVATGRMQDLPRGQVSGVTIRLLYAPLLARTEHKRRLYGQGIRQVCQTVLLLCGLPMETVQNLQIELGWQDPLPADDLALAQTLVALQQLGFSQHTLIDRADGDPDVEAQWRAEEQAQQTMAAAHGAGLPMAAGGPATTQPYQLPPQPGQNGQQPQAQASAPGGQTGAQPTPPTNHPAAVAARNQMKAAFGKPPTPTRPAGGKVQ